MKVKNNLKKVFLFLLLGAPVSIFAGSYEGDVISKTAQGIDFTQTLDLKDVKRVSMQATYSDGTPSAVTFAGGGKSTGSIRVNDYLSLAAKKAQVTITVSSNSAEALTGSYININGAPFRQGIEWQIGVSTRDTATSISNAIEAHEGYTSTHTLNASAIITASASAVGSYYNSFSVTSSTPTALVISGSTLSGGQDNAVIQFPTLGVTLTQGTDWFILSSTITTAKSIEDAFQGNSTLSSIFIATSPNASSIVYATVTANGATFIPISVSTPALVIANRFGIAGGTTSAVNLSTDTITVTTNTFTTGLKVLFSTAGATSIGGLTNQTTYYAIQVNDTSFRLATSSTNAANNSYIDLTSLALTNINYTLTPLALSAAVNTGFYWQASNDGSNFGNLSVSSVTYTAAGTTLWDFAEFGYRYLRLVFTGPTNGGIALRVRQYGKDN